MKKAFLFLMACCLSLTMSAKVAYLIPVAQRVDMGCQECDLPYEECTNGEQSPERRAFKWFRDNYTGEKTVLYLNDLANIPADVNAIWIHVDRVGFTDSQFDGVFNSTVKANLQAFVNRGGNLFLAKQAVRLEKDLVGAKKSNGDIITPGYACGGYRGAETWGMDYKFYDWNEEKQRWGTNRGHAIFKDLPHADDNYAELVWSDGRQITDNNDIFSLADLEMGDVWDGDKLWAFQERNNCKVLAGWANGDGCHCGGLIEFYPTGDRKGTVLVMGLAAYQWINNNAGNGFANTTKFTSNVLTYLNGPSRSDVHIDEDFRADGREGADGDAHNRFMILHPNVRGLNAVAYDVIENAGITEKFNDGGNRLAFTGAGHVKLQIKLNETRQNQSWAQGIYAFTRDIDFAFNTTAQAIADADLSSNGLDGETGKFMVLHHNMRGLAAPIENYEISYDGIEEANRAVVEKFWDGEFDRLKFTKAGTVKLNITLNSDVHNTEYGKGAHHVVKTVTFAQPAFSWTHNPDNAAVTEYKDPAQATCDVHGTTVMYESDNAEIASINAENGQITYIKAGECNIYAYIEINGVKYRSAPFPISVSGMTVNWTTAPLESINAGDTMTIAAAPVYGSAVAKYETTNCTYADGKLTFETVGTATVRPYVEGYGDDKFYGEKKTITVSAPVLTWHDGSFPHDGTIGESKPSIWAWLNGKTDTRVQYRSLDAEYIEINGENFLIYKKPTTGDGVAIEAYVEIGGVEYKLTQMTKSGAPVVSWTTQPAAIAFVTGQVSVAAAVNFGTLLIQYKVSGCTCSDGKLTFSAGGSATVRPYVEAYGERYYGEQKTITVVDPATTNPSAATAFLLLGDANALPESERNCAEWFLNGNVKSGAGRYLTLTDLSNIPATVKTIIIHADRESVFNFSTYAPSLATWVKAGGNLVLMRQATILAYQMGRIDYAPHNEALQMEDDPHQAGMGDRTETDFTSINVCMGTRSGEPALEANSKGETVVDRSGDDFFNGMTIDERADGQKIIVLNTATRRASNRCFWQEMYYQNPGSGKTADYATESRAKFDTFESKYNLQVLAVEAGILDFCLPAIIRFKSGMYNGEQWNGSIMAIGAGGFQFNNQNQANFEVLNSVVENAEKYVAGSACSNCFRITIR